MTALIARHELFVRRIAARLVGAQDAEDVVQRVWLRVWRKQDQFEGRAQFTTWLYAVTRNMAKDWLRDHSRLKDAPRVALPVETALTVADHRYLPPDLRVHAAQQRRRLDRAVLQLPAPQQAIVLGVLSGLSLVEIAEGLAIPAGTAKTRLYRALPRLRAALQH